MSNCCSTSRCNCRVTAGPRITVDGNGSAVSPYVISGDSQTTAIQAADSPTVDVTVLGTGAAADPYHVSADVKLAPAPPGGGSNLIGVGTGGLYVECAEVRGCLSAGNGAAYAPTTGKVSARLSTDAANTVQFGTDGGLFAPSPALPVLGCGLTGNGTAAAPITAAPVAGQQPWTNSWDRDAVANSTLKCDPTTGKLWTPPEHTSATVAQQQLHSLGTPTIGVVAWSIINSSIWSQAQYTADTLTACRGVSFAVTFSGHVEVTRPASATFELGYAVSINGGTSSVRRMHSWLQSGAAAGHDLVSFTLHQAFALAPHTGATVVVYPAIHVTAGSVTINEWITETLLIAITT